MNISKQYAWRAAENYRENNHLLPRNLRGLVIGKSECGKTTVIFHLLLQPGWLDYNHLYVFGKSLYQQEYRVVRKGLDARLRKQLLQQSRSIWGYITSLLLKYLAVHVLERYELTFMMIVKVFQIHQHWTLHKRICCCWTTACYASRIKLKCTILEVDTTIAIRYILHKTISLPAQFFAGNTTVRNELVHVLDALHRFKQLTRKEYADITARLAAALLLHARVHGLQCGDTGMEDLEL